MRRWPVYCLFAMFLLSGAALAFGANVRLAAFRPVKGQLPGVNV